ncbi:hypothetical protein ACHAWF_005809, partial [Thalassiosira exigua]
MKHLAPRGGGSGGGSAVRNPLENADGSGTTSGPGGEGEGEGVAKPPGSGGGDNDNNADPPRRRWSPPLAGVKNSPPAPPPSLAVQVRRLARRRSDLWLLILGAAICALSVFHVTYHRDRVPHSHRRPRGGGVGVGGGGRWHVEHGGGHGGAVRHMLEGFVAKGGAPPRGRNGDGDGGDEGDNKNRQPPLQLPPKLAPNRNDPLLGGGGSSEGSGGSIPHPVAHLSCHDHGGPANQEIVDSMVFWSDIPSDAEYLSPMHPLRDPNTDDDEERYLTFEPDHGGWNNQMRRKWCSHFTWEFFLENSAESLRARAACPFRRRRLHLRRESKTATTRPTRGSDPSPLSATGRRDRRAHGGSVLAERVSRGRRSIALAGAERKSASCGGRGGAGRLEGPRERMRGRLSAGRTAERNSLQGKTTSSVDVEPRGEPTKKTWSAANATDDVFAFYMGQSAFGFEDFFHLDAIAVEHKGFKVIAMEEFLIRSAMRGELRDSETKRVSFPPGNRTSWDGGGRPNVASLWKYLRSVSTVPTWDAWKCALAIPSSTDPSAAKELNETFRSIMDGSYGKPRPTLEEFNGNPVPVNASVAERMREMLADRDGLCIYDKPLQESKVIHLKVADGVRYLTV